MNPAEHLYIHVPFCANRCDYCDFYSEAGRRHDARRYVESLLDEFDEFADRIGELKTVFVGGGTPSLLPTDLLGGMLKRILTRSHRLAEVTMEANPSTITEELAEVILACGVNRVSLGVQSFQPQLRKNLGRTGQVETIGRAVSILRRAGCGNIGLDMIFGIPGQDLEHLERDIEAVQALEPEHISYYELTVKTGSSYHKRWEAPLHQVSAKARDFYEAVVGLQTAAGYQWYETSNYARPGYQCLHNLAYWEGRDYLGIGAGAWSTFGKRRWKNIESISAYIDGKVKISREHEELSAVEKKRERLMLGLRCQAGVSYSEVESEVVPAKVESLSEAGFLQKSGDRLFLTHAGRFLGNEISVQLIR